MSMPFFASEKKNNWNTFRRMQNGNCRWINAANEFYWFFLGQSSAQHGNGVYNLIALFWCVSSIHWLHSLPPLTHFSNSNNIALLIFAARKCMRCGSVCVWVYLHVHVCSVIRVNYTRMCVRLFNASNAKITYFFFCFSFFLFFFQYIFFVVSNFFSARVARNNLIHFARISIKSQFLLL